MGSVLVLAPSHKGKELGWTHLTWTTKHSLGRRGVDIEKSRQGEVGKVGIGVARDLVAAEAQAWPGLACECVRVSVYGCIRERLHTVVCLRQLRRLQASTQTPGLYCVDLRRWWYAYTNGQGRQTVGQPISIPKAKKGQTDVHAEAQTTKRHEQTRQLS